MCQGMSLRWEYDLGIEQINSKHVIEHHELELSQKNIDLNKTKFAVQDSKIHSHIICLYSSITCEWTSIVFSKVLRPTYPFL